MNEEINCSTCAHYGDDEYCEDCEKLDLWNPKDASGTESSDGTTVTLKVNDGPEVTLNAKALNSAMTAQTDLDGNIISELEETIEEDVRTYHVFRHGGLTFRITDKGYEKMVDPKTGDGDIRKNILCTIQRKIRISPKVLPIVMGQWDEAVHAIHARILDNEGLH